MRTPLAARPLWAVCAIVLPVVQGCQEPETPAQWPSKTVKLVCPWAAGGGTDRISRFWADALQEKFGKPFVVVNRTGGSGAVGHTAVANAQSDGYTIGMITFELSTMHRTGITELTCDNFNCIAQVNADPAAIIVRADSPWTTLDDFLAAVKASPGKIRMSGTATGGAWDLARAGLLEAADLPINGVKWVPTDGAAPSLFELQGGHIDAVCCSAAEAASQLEAGQLRLLAVMADERQGDYPETPTAKESGFDWVAVGWRGLAAPANTPAEIVNQLSSACEEIASSAEYQQFMKKNGFNIVFRPADEFATFLKQQDAQWKPVVEAAGYAK